MSLITKFGRLILASSIVQYFSFLKDANSFSTGRRSVYRCGVQNENFMSPKSIQKYPTEQILCYSTIGSSLFSMKQLVDDVAQASVTSSKKTIFVGGKGGVGKTTVSSSLAVELAANQDLKVLIVSTDPAHSLGDALDVDLKSGHGKPIVMTDPLTRGNLYASEINAEEALNDFRQNLASFDVDRLAQSFGIPADFLEGMGLREFSDLLSNPPPGLDELVALGNVMDSDKVGDYDVVLIDTAPTGHTLRLLSLPQFLDGLLGKLIKLRMKLSGVASTLQAFLGDSGAQQRVQTIDNAMNRLEEFQRKIKNMEIMLRDKSRTSFIVVTIPTKLAVEESKRLISDLTTQGIAVSDIVVNQCLTKVNENESDGILNYYKRRRGGQKQWIETLKEAAHDVSISEEYQSNGSSSPITITEFPFFDTELVGIPALGYVGSQQIVDNPSFQHLMNYEEITDEPKVIICGGKGGVGKTTTSSSLAVSLASKGHKVALISTDPAHSLSDAIAMDLSGGDLIDCPIIGIPGATGEGSLSIMEIDPSSALSQFKGIVDNLIGKGGDKSTGEQSDLRSTLQDLESIFDTLPAGADEVVALAKVVNLVKKGGFDRIVLDTAPTGHTLRMLGTPGFLAELIDRLLEIAKKVNSNAAVKMFITNAVSGQDGEQIESTGTVAKSQLISFQLQMYDLEDLFANPDQTEFLIVTVPTELAVRESVRLLNDLTFEAPDMPIKVRNIVMNQVLRDDDVTTFLSRVSDGQLSSIESLEEATRKMSNPPGITKVQYLDTEPRGVFGLKVLGDELMKGE